MRYTDSMERSAEYLRGALAQMTRQRAALHPTSYSVWYEYVSGRNPELQQAMGKLLANGGTLDEQQTWRLFSQHVAEWDERDTQRIRLGFQRVLTDMAASASLAGDQTSRFGASLTNLGERLEQDSTPGEVVSEILSGVREMQEAMSELRARMDANRHEIEALRRDVEQARGEALVDALTGLANRRAFDTELSQTLSASGAAPACLMLADIDHFKRINDSYGHAFGDQVLRVVAQTLKNLTGGKAMAARVGGEEFAILMPGATLQQAQALAERLRESISAGRIRRGQTANGDERVTLSFGVTQCHQGESANEFFSRADRALYASKNSGRNRVTVLAASEALAA
ncbi:MAG TPA: GGDEF domain-containing protein [Burkholderiaceae bacterium]